MMRARFATAFVVLMLGSAAAGVVVACSSDNPAPANGGTTTSGTTTVHVTAAAGGTVADPSGKTSLVIPPGALAKDTDITLALTPATAGGVVEVSEFGPDGLTFLKPVALTIKADAALATAGKSLALAVLENGAFKALEGSTYANGAATAPIQHFSKYSIILVDGKVILQPPKNCTDAVANFMPCGGDPKGTWTFADFCVPGQSLGADPFMGKCPGFSATGDFVITSEVTIDATTIKTSDGNQTTTATLDFPLSCVNSDGDGGTVDGGVSDCPSLQTQLNKNEVGKPQFACTNAAAPATCACTKTETTANPGNTKTYATSGNTLTTTDSTGKMSEPVEYCVNDNLLSVRGKAADGSTGILYVLNRK
jgi:hypothetical protein